MARRFVRIDLSDTARDFRLVALEPGVPLLDKSSGTAKILFRWLGGLVAEPEWDQESVNFFVRDEQGGRIEDVQCQLASVEDLKGILKADVEAVRERLINVKPETSTERAVHKLICAQFLDLIDNPNRLDRDNYFFRYRDVQGHWRLVWCWGYQRIEQQPATPLVCMAADCSLLFVRRPGESAKCPGCAAHVALAPVRRKSHKGRWAAALLLLLLAVLLGYRLLDRLSLQVTPEQWAGTVGERVEFQVMSAGLFGLGRHDVTREVEMRPDDPRIVRIDTVEDVAVAVSPGQTKIRFVLGKSHRFATATMTVAAAADQPASAQAPAAEIAKLPAVEAGKESSAHAGKPADAAKPSDAGTQPVMEPAKEPVAETRKGPSDAMPAAAAGDRPAELAIVSDQGARVRFPAGAQFSDFRVEARYADGMTRLVTQKAALSTAEDDEKSPVSFEEGRLVGVRPGRTTVMAEFEGVRTKTGLNVEVLGPDALVLRNAKGKPIDALQMRVGERLGLGADLTVLRGDADVSKQCAVAPMTPAVVKFDQEARSLVAVAPGQSPVKFSQGDKSLLAMVQVTPPGDAAVVAEPITELRLEPVEATIHPGQGILYQVTGMRGGQRRVLGPQDGIRLSIVDGAVASPIGGTAVQGEGPGRTEILARVGQQQAQAILHVTSGEGVPQAVVEVLPGVGVGVVEGMGPGVEYFDADGVHRIQPVVRPVGPAGAMLVDVPGAAVAVRPTETLTIEPRRVSVQVGESTPPYVVALRGADGAQRVVKGAKLVAEDPILVRDGKDPARFTAQSLGRTQVRATYGGREAIADVTVAGERFTTIKTAMADQGERDFEVSAEIIAADCDTPLEYRVYVAGQTPSGKWTPSQQQGRSRRAVVESPRITTGPPSASYQLMFEARDPRDKSIQKYPYTFRLGRTIEEVKSSAAPKAGKPAAAK